MPLLAHAQQTPTPVVRYISAGAPDVAAYLATAFRKALNEVGYVEGKNVTIEYRWAHNDYGRVSKLTVDLVEWRDVT